jgi:hypothetical protein
VATKIPSSSTSARSPSRNYCGSWRTEKRNIPIPFSDLEWAAYEGDSAEVKRLGRVGDMVRRDIEA